MTKWGSQRNKRLKNVLFSNNNRIWDCKFFKVYVVGNRIYFPEIRKRDRVFSVHCDFGKHCLLQNMYFDLPVLIYKGRLKKFSGHEVCVVADQKYWKTTEIAGILVLYFRKHRYWSVEEPSKENPYPIHEMLMLSRFGRWVPFAQLVADAL
jgi:hypothetical protein